MRQTLSELYLKDMPGFFLLDDPCPLTFSTAHSPTL